ncbi:MAG: DNA starvation/stationary phase protection protein [Tepidisphaeraceae bacterium]|jgi:starvation-inducible DNA-binding protein
MMQVKSDHANGKAHRANGHAHRANGHSPRASGHRTNRFSTALIDGQTQEFGVMQRNPLGLDLAVATQSADELNQLLADTLTIRDLYKKHHWQAAGPMFYMIHLLYDKHFEEQSKLVDLVAERIQTLGGLAIAMAADVAEATKIARPPKDREPVPTQIARLLDAHDMILYEARNMAEDAETRGDLATNDILVSNVIRTNELQAWFLDQHVR